MKDEILVQCNYLMIPITKEKEYKTISFFVEEDKLYEFKIPLMEEENNDTYQYKAPVPVALYIGKKIRIEGDYTEAFFNEITQSNIIPDKEEQHPIIHFTSITGWINDPNGLIYKDGIYHLYFQYNPFDTRWENMCWGHAVSDDLLHWEQKDTVLYPDEEGTMYSGSGIVNEHALLGLQKDAAIYFYTSAGNTSDWSNGKLFTQKIAYSTDGGNILHKKEGCIVDYICDENRDPKVYWHEQTKAYVMVLYLTNNDYAILRSVDLENWNMSQRITLDKACECPDLLEVPIVGGGSKWLFWSADGYYFLGEFDGFVFTTDGIRREAYKTKLPYAAQTFWGLKDRIVTIPWIRSFNKSKLYTGTMGIPRELKLVEFNEELILSQLPVKEFGEQEELKYVVSVTNKTVHYHQEEKAVVEIRSDLIDIQNIEWFVYGTQIGYDSNTGMLRVAQEDTRIGSDIKDLSIIVDSEIIEITANNGILYAVYELETDDQCGTIMITAEGNVEIEIYQLK